MRSSIASTACPIETPITATAWPSTARSVSVDRSQARLGMGRLGRCRPDMSGSSLDGVAAGSRRLAARGRLGQPQGREILCLQLGLYRRDIIAALTLSKHKDRLDTVSTSNFRFMRDSAAGSIDRRRCRTFTRPQKSSITRSRLKAPDCQPAGALLSSCLTLKSPAARLVG